MTAKVCIISTYLPYPKYKDGATIRLYNMVSELVAINAHVVYIFIDINGDSAEIVNNELNIDFRIISMTRCQKIMSNFRIDALGFTSIKRKFNEIFKYDEFDYVICEGMFPASLLSPSYDKLIVNVVDAMSLVALREIRSKSYLTTRPYLRFIRNFLFEVTILRRFNNIVVVSSDDAEYLSRRTDKHTYVIHNGVDLAEFNPDEHSRNTESSRKICFVANFQGFMNNEALNYLVHHVSPAIFDLLGVRTMVVGKNIPDFAKNEPKDFLEIHEDVDSTAEHIASSDIFVCPVIFGSGIKNSVLQAVALNKPVICYKPYMSVHFLKEKHNGFGFNKRDEIVSIIASFYDSKDPPIIDNSGLVRDHLLWSSCMGKTLSLVNKRYF
jgi:polysaccharide biosynthesis protein PslH